MGARHATLLVPMVTVLCASCGLIGGIDEITLVEAQDSGVNDASATDAPQDDAEPATCVLGDDGKAFLRLGNLVPSEQAYDFCIKPAGSEGFDGVRPLLAAGGGGCPPGISYKQLTMAFRVAAGTHDVRVVEAGAQTCDKPLADLSAVATSDNRSTSVFVFLDSDDKPMLRQLPETPSTFNKSQVRFVNALVGRESIDCGVTNSPRLPATIVTPIFSDVAFAGVSPAGVSAIDVIDDNGYLVYSMNGGTVLFGIAEPGLQDALVTLATKFALSSSHTLFAIGQVGDAEYPPAMWSCNEKETDGILTLCGDPLELGLEVYSTQLTDMFMPLFGERIEPVREAVAQGTADVICVNELRNPVFMDALLQEAAGAYDHRVSSDGVELSPSDLTDQSGSTPEPYVDAACSGELEPVLHTLMDCVDENCTQDDGTGHRFINDGQVGADCVSAKCAAEATPLILTEDPATQRCWMCALTQMSGEETTEYVREACTTDPAAEFVYQGAQGIAVLSRYPIREARRWLLPSTSWQRGLILASMDLPNGVALDFYCGDLSLPSTGILFPYVGHYGADAEDAARWVAEQELQAERVLEIVDAQSSPTGARVVLAITPYAGPSVMQDGTEVLAAQSPTVYDLLGSSLSPLVASAFVPECTQCTANPIFSGSSAEGAPAADAWTTHLFGRWIDSRAVLSSVVTFKEASYEVPTADGPRSIPPSSHYGLRSVVRLTH